MLRKKSCRGSDEMHSATLVRSRNEDSRHGYLSALCVACALLANAAVANAAGAAGAAGATLDLDASEAPRGIERAHLVLPVEHGPDGPIGSLSTLKFVANGQTLQWRRDSTNMYAFHLKIPAGATALDVTLEVLAVRDATNQNADRTSTDALAIILWNQVLLYPAGARSDDLQYTARLELPPHWGLATALPQAGATGDYTQFRSVSLTTLIDSPVLAGSHVRTFELGGTPPAFLHLAADSDAALNAPEATQAHMRQLVREANALFGAAHYGEYHFLWTLSDRIGY